MAISVRLSKEDETLFKSYAKVNNITLSDLVKNAVTKYIEDEIDLETYKSIVEEKQLTSFKEVK